VDRPTHEIHEIKCPTIKNNFTVSLDAGGNYHASVIKLIVKASSTNFKCVTDNINHC